MNQGVKFIRSSAPLYPCAVKAQKKTENIAISVFPFVSGNLITNDANGTQSVGPAPGCNGGAVTNSLTGIRKKVSLSKS